MSYVYFIEKIKTQEWLSKISEWEMIGIDGGLDEDGDWKGQWTRDPHKAWQWEDKEKAERIMNEYIVDKYSTEKQYEVTEHEFV